MKNKLLLLAMGFALTTQMIMAQVPSYVPTNGLVGYWPFNGNANDESGNGNNGNIFGNFNFLANNQGRLNCIELIGDNNSTPTNSVGEPLYINGGYFKFPNLASEISNSISINLWIRCLSNVPNEYAFFAGIDDFGQNRIVFDYYQGFSIGNNNPLAMVPYPFNSNIDEWKMLTMVYSPGDLKAFINGQLIGSNNNTITSIQTANAALNWHIWANGNSARGWSVYDDVTIYNRPLLTSEITQLYNSVSSNECLTMTINTGVLSTTPVTYTSSVTIYPNPANDQITIDCGNLTNVVGWNIKITNMLGQEVFNQPMNTQQYVVPLNSWTGQGMYFVKIINAQNEVVNIKKIILQ